MRREVEPVGVEVELAEADAEEPTLTLTEWYPSGVDVGDVRTYYQAILGPDGEVEVDERDGRPVVRASTNSMPRAAVLNFGALVVAGLVGQAGGRDQLETELGGEPSRGYQ